MDPFLAVMLSLVTLLFISLGTYFLSKKTRIPYTVLLVVVGLLLVPISQIELFGFIRSFELTPELLFFVILPTLIFESSYNMNARAMMRSIRSISLLSVLSLLISTAFIACALHYGSTWIGYSLPFSMTLLFGALISATDPVAVLALFKEYGAPKRLSLIFEGESLFNDGTSLALFLVVLQILTMGWNGMTSITEGVIMFTSMVVGGILFGGLMGFIFSKLIERVRNNEHVEITLTMIVAHFTFIFSELLSHGLSLFDHEIRFSSIIATVVAAMVVGNYGRYKISPRIAEYMERFWGYFAFLANSIVFILIGLLFADIDIPFRTLAGPVALAVVIVMIGRALSVYPVILGLNRTKTEEYIPLSWQHLLAWGSLRGALAVTMVLLIPDDLTVAGWPYADITVKEYVTAFTIACIYFTLFIKATTIGPLIKKLKIDALTPIEEVEHAEGRALIAQKVLAEIERFHTKGYITDDIYQEKSAKYRAAFTSAYDACRHAMDMSDDTPERILTIYATGIEKNYLSSLFLYGEISERVYTRILNELAARLEKVENYDERIILKDTDIKQDWVDVLSSLPSRFAPRFFPPLRSEITLYMYYRARAIIARKVVDEIAAVRSYSADVFGGDSVFERLLKRYTGVETWAKNEADNIRRTHTKDITDLNRRFAEAGINKAKEIALQDLERKEVIAPKVQVLIHEEIEKGHIEPSLSA